MEQPRVGVWAKKVAQKIRPKNRLVGGLYMIKLCRRVLRTCVVCFSKYSSKLNLQNVQITFRHEKNYFEGMT